MRGFSSYLVRTSCCTNSRVASDLRRHDTQVTSFWWYRKCRQSHCFSRILPADVGDFEFSDICSCEEMTFSGKFTNWNRYGDPTGRSSRWLPEVPFFLAALSFMLSFLLRSVLVPTGERGVNALLDREKLRRPGDFWTAISLLPTKSEQNYGKDQKILKTYKYGLIYCCAPLWY